MSLKCSAAHRSPELWNFKEMSKYLEKFSILRKTIKAHGGLKGSFLQLYSFARERTRTFDYVENLKSKKALHSGGLWQKEGELNALSFISNNPVPALKHNFSIQRQVVATAKDSTHGRTDELKIGDLVGEDKYGNKYYQNKYYFVGRSRWVQYADKVNMDYDASQIPAEWHRWLHYSTDDPPTKVPPVAREWIEPHTENMSATPQEYVPYSTTKPKIESWIPPRKC